MASSQQHLLDIDDIEHARNLLQRLDSMRKQQKNCDLIICVEGKKIHVNRDVMCAASDYFDAMFSHNMKEKQEGVVEMKDVEFSAVKKCVDFVYTGKITVSEEECEGLLFSASLMQLNEICEKISPFLGNHVNSKSFFRIKRIAVKFSLEELNTICDEFASDQLFSLAEEHEFNNFDLDYLSYLLSSKTSSLPRMEDSKLAVAIQWIKADLENREKDFDRIVHTLDLTKITPGYSKFLVEEEPLCRGSLEFVRMLFLGNAAVGGVVATSHPDLSKTTPSPKGLILFDHLSKVVKLHRPSDNHLETITSYRKGMTDGFNACILKNDLFVFMENKEVFRVNITCATPKWDKLDNMLHDHGLLLRCTVSRNTVYVGGNDLMERCDLLKGGKWENIDLGGFGCCRSALTDYVGFIFLIGGGDEDSEDTVRKYSPVASKWLSVTPMNIPRANPSAVVYDCKLFVAGGYNDAENILLSDFEMYDYESELWTILPNMNTGRSPLGLCIIDDKIFAIGNGSRECSMEVYDSLTKKWIEHQNSPKVKIWAIASVSAYLGKH